MHKNAATMANAKQSSPFGILSMGGFTLALLALSIGLVEAGAFVGSIVL